MIRHDNAIEEEDIEGVASQLKVLLPRFVRQEQTRDLLKLKKSASQQIKEFGETLDNLCTLITFNENLRSCVYRAEDRIYSAANRLKTCEHGQTYQEAS